MLRSNIKFLDFIEKLYLQGDKSNSGIDLITFEKEEQPLVQGETSRYVWVLIEGVIKCFIQEENGKEYIIEFLGTGEICGEIEAIKNTSCLCNVKALSTVQAYQLSISFFKKLLNTDIAFNHLLLEAFSDRIINTSTRASYQQLFDSKKSLTKLLSLSKKQNLQLSKEDMASYLGISVRSLNRLLKEYNL